MSQAETMTDLSPEDLKAFFQRVNKGPEVLSPDERHARNLVEAYRVLDEIVQAGEAIGEATLKRLQAIIARDIHIPSKYKGEYALLPKETRSPLVPNPPPLLDYREIPQAMAELGADMSRFTQGSLEPVETIENAANFMWRLFSIHPFADGNGRLGRLVTDGILMRNGLSQTPSWTGERTGQELEGKKEYYDAVNASRVARANWPLGVFLAREQVRAVDITLQNVIKAGAYQEARISGELQRQMNIKSVLGQYIRAPR